MTLEYLLYNIGKAAIRNKIINYAAAGGSIYELNAETIQDYPILFASPTGQHEVRVNTTDYEISLYYLDRLLRDNSNDIQIYSTAVENLKLTLKAIEEIEGVIEISETYTISNFTETEGMNDRVAGAFATVTITILNTSDCDDIKVIDEFNRLKLQDKTMEITENGVYSITYDKGFEGLGTVEIGVDVPDLNGSYDEGYNQGKAEGLTEGYANGKADGLTEGFTQGKAEGITEGFTQGKEEGLTEGYNNGLEVGRSEGYSDGYTQGQTEGVEAYKETLPILDITQNGSYDTVNKGVNVNVIPKVNVKESGIKFAYASFRDIPDWADWEGITDMSNMFYSCYSITTISLIDTSSVTDMSGMFKYSSNLTTIHLLNTSNVTNMREMFMSCSKLTTIPLLDTSNVTNMEAMFVDCYALTTIPLLDTSKVTIMYRMFNGCSKLTTIPALNTSSVRDMNNMFGYCSSLTSLPALDCSSIGTDYYNAAAWFGYSTLNNLTEIGGFLNLKTKSDSGYGLVQCPNLTYQSCINVLNGLYDFTGNGETPNSEQGKLKVHANFLTTVGEDISIGLNKGWTITS